jgi:shikimate dehydrogenase
MTGPRAVRSSPAWPSGQSRLVGVIGDPIRHSRSPLLHNAAFDAMGLDWVSVAFAVPAERGRAAFEAMRTLGIVGLSVTMPHKEAAAAAADVCSPVVARLGAANCMTLRDGELVADSTDGEGFLAALRRSPGFDPAGRRCLVLGAGGAARAVILALAEAGAADVAVVNRDSARAERAAALAEAVGRVGSGADVAEAELVVNATPFGMEERPGIHPAVDPGAFHGGQVVADLVYHPAVTALLDAGAAAGAATVNGLGMLVHQAALAVEHWTGRPAPVEAMWAAVTE